MVPPTKTEPSRKRQPTVIYKIKVTLSGSKPLIWRSLQASAESTLFKMHRIILEAMGWIDSHLHQFAIGNNTYRIRDSYADFGVDGSWKNERTAMFYQIVSGKGFRSRYDYDFGDN